MQDPVHPCILPFLVQDIFSFLHDPANPCILPFLGQNNQKKAPNRRPLFLMSKI